MIHNGQAMTDAVAAIESEVLAYAVVNNLCGRCLMYALAASVLRHLMMAGGMNSDEANNRLALVKILMDKSNNVISVRQQEEEASYVN